MDINKDGLQWLRVDYDANAWVFSYRITFKASKSGTFYFEDEERDVYSCSVWRTTVSHTIDYNSSAPTIIGWSRNWSDRETLQAKNFADEDYTQEYTENKEEQKESSLLTFNLSSILFIC